MRHLRLVRSFSILRPTAPVARPWLSRDSHGFSTSTTSSTSATVQPVAAIHASNLDLESFREQAFRAEKPLLMKGSGDSGSSNGDLTTRTLPAISRWFKAEPGKLTGLASVYLNQFSMAQLPYELIVPADGGNLPSFLAWLRASGSDHSGVRRALAELLTRHIDIESEGTTGSNGETVQNRLVRLEAPFALFMAAVEYNESRAGTSAASASTALTDLYIAQASLTDLPHAMQLDVPMPDLVQQAGRGDVYASSLWLGLESTYTPWHRDPNPNLFCQLCSHKTVRVMAPRGGERVFQAVQMELMKQRAAASAPEPGSVSSRIRGEEMMQGPERRLLHEAVWSAGESSVPTSTSSSFQEAHLEPGDMLFIPKGWWHSVKSNHADGRLNGSVNWWFR